MQLDRVDYVIGVDEDADLAHLLGYCRENLRTLDEILIKKAFKICLDAHYGRVRKSGSKYYTHPLGVALIVVDEIPIDDTSVACALLHDVLNYSEKYNLNDIRREFGTTIAQIVEGVHKIKNIELHSIEQLNQLENYRKLLLSLFTDVRIILIKLADRLHNMRTLDFLPSERQRYLANETLEVYAPFANRFGLRSIKWELEDLAFRYLNREAYDRIKKSLKSTRQERELYVEAFKRPIVEKLANDNFLKKNEISFEISGRPKHIFSIYNKMNYRKKDLDELYDLFAVRLIIECNDQNMCFYIYSLIANIYKPVPGTFKDYINAPKKNGYQSIHTAVLGPDSKPVEVQIRTREMHLISEKGVAAHFLYKRGLLPAQSVIEDTNLQQWMDTVRSIFENAGDETPAELLENVKNNFFLDEIHIFTPANEMKTFPRNSTPLDFAFGIHTEIGYNCIGAKVNSKIVPLNYKLQNGDQVEILTSANQTPKKEWLKLVVTSKAKYLIKKYIKDDIKRIEDEGRQLWAENLNQRNIILHENDIQNLAYTLKYNSTTDFFIALGSRKLSLTKANEILEYKLKTGFTTNGINRENNNNKGVVSTLNMEVKFAKCCNPIPGDLIKALISDTNRIVIHRSECNELPGLLRFEPGGKVDINWSDLAKQEYISVLHIESNASKKIIGDITEKIIDADLEIEGINSDKDDNKILTEVSVSVPNLDVLNSLIDSLSSINGVAKVQRI